MATERGGRVAWSTNVARRALLAVALTACAGCLLVLPTSSAPIVVECVSQRSDGTGGLRRVLRADGEGFVQALDAAGVVRRTEREFDLGGERVRALHDALLALCVRDHGDAPGAHAHDPDEALRRRVAERESATRAGAAATIVHRLELIFDDLRLQTEVPFVAPDERAELSAWDRHALALVDAVLAVFDSAR
ncbi:MAG: hypothetical protein H6825_14100 [Planctomycetes bacterium]|nr:hypothetical protein [Planctomycetota bacterium]